MFWVVMFALPMVVVAAKLPSKAGLALAVSATPFALALTVLMTLLSMTIEDAGPMKNALIISLLVLFIAAQICIVVGAISAYRAMPREPRDKRTLAFGVVNSVVWYGIFFVLAGTTLPGMIVDRKRMNENTAVSQLRTLNVALAVYQQTYPNVGLPPSLATLGGADFTPGTSQAASLVPRELACASGPCVDRGYIFTYTPVNRTGPNFAYTLTARPVLYRKDGTRSFFTDASTTIRFTSEDRAPTVKDEALQ